MLAQSSSQQFPGGDAAANHKRTSASTMFGSAARTRLQEAAHADVVPPAGHVAGRNYPQRPVCLGVHLTHRLVCLANVKSESSALMQWQLCASRCV